MLQKINSENIAGESWDRALRIVIENPLVGSTLIRFVEERVTELEDGTVLQTHLGDICKEISSMGFMEPVPIRNPSTGEPTGDTLTYADLYVIISSVYIHIRDQLDNGATAGDAPPDPEEPTDPDPVEPTDPVDPEEPTDPDPVNP